MRTHDLAAVLEPMMDYLHELHRFHPFEWISNEDNIALTNEGGDIALFEKDQDGIYYGHYFFKSRGREAIKAAKGFLSEVFEHYPVSVIKGLTPTTKLGALWMNRQLGFTDYGIIETEDKPCHLVILTRKEWTLLNEEKKEK